VAVLLETHDQILRLLHPFMPFVTEEIWQALPRRPADGLAADGRSQTITLSAFPARREDWLDESAALTVERLQEVVTAIRTVRAEFGITPSRRLSAFVEGATTAQRRMLAAHQPDVMRLTGLDRVEFAVPGRSAPDTVKRVVRGMRIHLPLAGLIDRNKEVDRIRRELARLAKQQGDLRAMLGNPAFVERADPEVVNEKKIQVQNVGVRREMLEEILQELVG